MIAGFKQKTIKLLLSLLLIAAALLTAAPILLTVISSLMTEGEIMRNYGPAIGGSSIDESSGFATMKLIPDRVTLAQYKAVLIDSPRFLNMYWNSVMLVAPILIGATVVSSLAGYAFGLLRFRGRDWLFLLYLMTMLMPFQVTMVPNYLILSKLGLLNTSLAIILPGIFGAFGVFLMRQFMAQLPVVLLEAAKMDGAGHFTIFTRIALPLVKPGLSALVVLQFADYWNMVEQPLIFIEDVLRYPLSLYLAQIGQEAIGVVFAASVIYMAPMVLLFLYTENEVVEGIQHTGIKR